MGQLILLRISVLFLKKVFEKSYHLFLTIITAVLLIFIVIMLYKQHEQKINDDFNAGYNAFNDMINVHHVQPSGIEEFIYYNDDNKTNIQYACNDKQAIDMLIMIFGDIYVTQTCSVAGAPID